MASRIANRSSLLFWHFQFIVVFVWSASPLCFYMHMHSLQSAGDCFMSLLFVSFLLYQCLSAGQVMIVRPLVVTTGSEDKMHEVTEAVNIHLQPDMCLSVWDTQPCCAPLDGHPSGNSRLSSKCPHPWSLTVCVTSAFITKEQIAFVWLHTTSFLFKFD